MPSLRPADVRFLLPDVPTSVRLLGKADEPHRRRAFEAAGVTVGAGPPDLVVTRAKTVADAVALGADDVVVEGRLRVLGAAALQAGGYRLLRCVVRHGAAGMRLVVPGPTGRLALPAFSSGGAGALGPARRLAIRGMLRATAAGVPLPATVTIASRRTGLPSVLAAASTAGLPADVAWYLLAGDGDDLQRMVWLCAPAGAREPVWAVKWSRVPGYDRAFESDLAGMKAIEAAPAAVRARVPQVLGRFRSGSHHGSVETAVPGVPLRDVLRGPDRSSALSLIRAVATWSLDLAAGTAQPADALAGERRRLGEVVVPQWAAEGAPLDLVDRLPPVPAVAQHNDLGSWNIVTDRSTFAVVDWESATTDTVPLWDLLYFLSDALVVMERRRGQEQELAAMVDLLAGRLASSALLFDLVRRGAQRLGVPLGSVGAIATLAWLHHGLSAERRHRTHREHGAVSGVVSPGPLQRLAPRWLRHPALGVGWPALTSSG